MSTDTEAIYDAALGYGVRGYHVFPLKPKTKTPWPAMAEWQNISSSAAEMITHWWKKWPHSNVAVQLGPRSGIIDIECDTPEEEAALLAIFGGDVPVCPTFTSNRGKHRIFAHVDGLPDSAIVKVDGIGFRIGNKGAFSCFPPSVHEKGAVYAWLPGLSPDDVDPPALPQDVLDRLGYKEVSHSQNGHSKPIWHAAMDKGVIPEGERNATLASFLGSQFANAKDLEDAKNLNSLFLSARACNVMCQPPLGDKELQATFSSILRAERNKRAQLEAEGLMCTMPDQEVAAAAEATAPVKEPIASDGKKENPLAKAFRMVIVRSDPPVYELYCAGFSRAKGGCIRLSGEQVVSGRAIRVQAIRQAEYPLSAAFSKKWDLSLYEQLTRNADTVDAPAEEKRWWIVIDRLRDRLASAKDVDPGKPPSRGRPSRMPDGSVVFLFRTIWEELSMSADRVTRAETSAALKSVGATWKSFEHIRFKRIDVRGIERCEELWASGFDENEHV